GAGKIGGEWQGGRHLLDLASARQRDQRQDVAHPGYISRLLRRRILRLRRIGIARRSRVDVVDRAARRRVARRRPRADDVRLVDEAEAVAQAVADGVALYRR